MSANTRIRGACKLCKHSCLFYGGQHKYPTGVWCIARNGKIRKAPKEALNCKWFEEKIMEK